MEFLKTKNKTVQALGQADAWLQITMRRCCPRNCNASVGRGTNFLLSQDKGVFCACLKGIQEDETEKEHVITGDAGKEIVWN